MNNLEETINRYNSVLSEWIDYVDRSDFTDDGMCIVVVQYTNQQGFSNGDLWFWASEDDYAELILGTGAEYKANWENEKMTWYANNNEFSDDFDPITFQDYGESDDSDDFGGGDDYYDDEGSDSGNDFNDDSPNYQKFSSNDGNQIKMKVPEKFSIDGRTYRGILENRNQGFDDDDYIREKFRLADSFDDNETLQNIKFMVDKIDNADDLFERVQVMKGLIANESLTGMKLFKMFFSDIEGMFGISIEKKLRNQIFQSIGLGKLSPQMYNRIKYQIKQVYDIMGKEGIKGLSNLGNSMLREGGQILRSSFSKETYIKSMGELDNSQKIVRRYLNKTNPFSKNRYFYKGKEAFRTARQVFKKDEIFYGDDAVKQIMKYHKSMLKKEAQGIIKMNSHHLEKVVGPNGKIGYRWNRKGIRKLSNNSVIRVIDKGLLAAEVIPVVGEGVIAAKYGLKIGLNVIGLSSFVKDSRDKDKKGVSRAPKMKKEDRKKQIKKDIKKAVKRVF